MTSDTSDDETRQRTTDFDPTRSKVGHKLDEYKIGEFGKELVRLWTTESDDRRSLRELAAIFNQRLLRAVIEDAGLIPLDEEVENMCRLLANDGTSAGASTQAETTL